METRPEFLQRRPHQNRHNIQYQDLGQYITYNKSQKQCQQVQGLVPQRRQIISSISCILRKKVQLGSTSEQWFYTHTRGLLSELCRSWHFQHKWKFQGTVPVLLEIWIGNRLIMKHDSLIPIILVDVADIIHLSVYENLRHFAVKFVATIGCTGVNRGLQLNTVIPQTLGRTRLDKLS